MERGVCYLFRNAFGVRASKEGVRMLQGGLNTHANVSFEEGYHRLKTASRIFPIERRVYAP